MGLCGWCWQPTRSSFSYICSSCFKPSWSFISFSMNHAVLTSVLIQHLTVNLSRFHPLCSHQSHLRTLFNNGASLQTERHAYLTLASTRIITDRALHCACLKYPSAITYCAYINSLCFLHNFQILCRSWFSLHLTNMMTVLRPYLKDGQMTETIKWLFFKAWSQGQTKKYVQRSVDRTTGTGREHPRWNVLRSIKWRVFALS